MTTILYIDENYYLSLELMERKCFQIFVTDTWEIVGLTFYVAVIVCLDSPESLRLCLNAYSWESFLNKNRKYHTKGNFCLTPYGFILNKIQCMNLVYFVRVWWTICDVFISIRDWITILQFFFQPNFFRFQCKRLV